jgi:hypothetical protein
MYNDSPAAIFDNSTAYHNFVTLLKLQNVSYKTKIQRGKRNKPPKFIVQVFEA